MIDTKKLTISLTIIFVIIVTSLIIIASIKQQDVKYINSHIGSFNAETVTTHDKVKLQSGTYDINDFKPNGKELDISKKESNEIYSINLDDKHIEYRKDNNLDKNEVKIKTPSKHVDFSFFKSNKDKAKITIYSNDKHIKIGDEK